LTEARWEGTEFGNLARSQLAAYLSADPQRLRLQGDPVILPPDLATPFGLVLHELATNAAKYGAFSVDKGQVLLKWSLDAGNGNRLFMVTWKEAGGPRVSAPKRTGFGGTLIERSLPGAKVRREFKPGGVICTIELELPPRRSRRMEKSTERDRPLRGMKILVADDEFLILVCIEEALRGAGAEIVSASNLPGCLGGRQR